MKKSDVQIGQTYAMNHSSGRITVRIHRTKEHRSFGIRINTNHTTTHWIATNLKTGREIEIKSARRLEALPACPVQS